MARVNGSTPVMSAPGEETALQADQAKDDECNSDASGCDGWAGAARKVQKGKI